MTPDFGHGDYVLLSGFDGYDYKLFKSTWEIKLARPERAHIEYNYHKIVETLEKPDEVRRSKWHKDCFIAYRDFGFYWVRPQVSAPNPPGLKCFAVVADGRSRIIKTFYPVIEKKPGEKIWPKT